MLAQPPKIAGEDVAEPAVSPASDRSGQFRRAEAHSRRVRSLKWILPAIGLLLAGGFAVQTYLASPGSVTVQADSSALSEGKLVMANPKLEGFTKDDLPYSVSAARAVQDVNDEAMIELEGIGASLPLDALNSVTIDAPHGILDRVMNTLDLDEALRITTTDGMVATLQTAFVDMAAGTMRTDKPVDISLKGATIRSNAMSVTDNGKVLIFEKSVRVHIDPAKARELN